MAFERKLTGLSEGGYSPEYLKQIIAAYPQAWESYKTLGDDDQRSFGEWLKAFIAENPETDYRSLDAYQQKQNVSNAVANAAAQTFDNLEPLSETQLAAVKKFTDASPEHKKILNESFGGDMQKFAQWFSNWWQGSDGVSFLSDPNNNISDAEMELLGSLGFSMDGGQDTPLEQELLNKVYAQGTADMAGNAARQAQAQAVIDQNNKDLNATRTLNDSLLAKTSNWSKYVTDNPDISAYFNSSAFETLPDGTKKELGTGRVYASVEDYAKAHYEAFGDNGRPKLETSTQRLADEYANTNNYVTSLTNAATQAASDSKAALAQQYGAKTAALDAEGVAKGDALTKYNLDALNAINTLESEKRALIAQNGQEIDAAIKARNNERIAAIDAQTAQLGQAITTLDSSRNSALDTQAAAQGQALDSYSASLLQALDPVATERLNSARVLASSINQGAETAKDNLVAQQAAQGYVGGSSMDTAAIARAGLDARQQAAQAMGNARFTNATDKQGVANTVSKERFSLDNATAQDRRGIADSTSQARFDLSSSDAGLRKGAADEAGTARFDLASGLADKRLAVGNEGATSRATLATDTAGARKALADYLATGKTGLTNANADSAFAIGTQLATDKKDAATQGANLKQSYFDNDLTRQLSAATTNAQLGQLQLSNIGKAEQIGWGGTDRMLDRLNWFSTSATPTTATATTTQADETGSLWAGIGSGLLSGGMSLAAANMKNKTPTNQTMASSSLTGSTSGKLYSPIS